MQNYTFTNHNRPDFLLLTGLLFLVPPFIAWLAVFSIVANIGILGKHFQNPLGCAPQRWRNLPFGRLPTGNGDFGPCYLPTGPGSGR